MRAAAVIFLGVLFVPCGKQDAQGRWEKRLSAYATGDDALPLLAELEKAHCPVRFTPNIPVGEEHALYFLPGGVVHLITQTSEPGRILISAPPFFVADDKPASDRLARYDRAWDDHVKKLTGH